MSYGHFEPDGVYWRVNQEITVLFGGVRALLMHGAHPLVAAGARQTATYRRDPWHRLLRTLSLQLLLGFGTTDEANRAADRINRLHTIINGIDPVTGRRYDALDPDLLLWVHACLEQSSVIFYEKTVGPLDGVELKQYHEDNLVAAELMLLDREDVPPTYEALEEYVQGVIDAGDLIATDVARELAHLVRGGPVPWHLKPIWRFVSFAAVGTLPPEIRRLYGYRWGPWRQKALDLSFAVLKRVRPWLPARFRYVLPAQVARRRLAGEEVEMPRP